MMPLPISLALSFVNPGMLGFLSLAVIPLIIYLINRQRFQRVPWAAMEFLLAAMRKNKRRLQLENLLLLLGIHHRRIARVVVDRELCFDEVIQLLRAQCEAIGRSVYNSS